MTTTPNKTQPKDHSIVKPILTSLLLFTSASMAFLYSAAFANTSTASQAYQTYVIDTYGGAALLPAVRQQLFNVEGGSASIYQDKIILRTTPNGYAAVQRLISQIDQAPIPLTLSVKVGGSESRQSTTTQGQIVISNDSYNSNHFTPSSTGSISIDSTKIDGYANISRQNNLQTNSSLYHVSTLSGSSAFIGTSTLLSLWQPQTVTTYNQYGTAIGHIRINGHILAESIQGISVTPKVMPDNQVQVTIHQVEGSLSNNTNTTVPTLQNQQLATTIVIPRGYWASIGQVSQSGQYQSNSTYGNSSTQYPIEIRVD